MAGEPVMRRLRVVLVVACLVGDIATPLGSGAFRLDPTLSIEDVGWPPRMHAAARPRTASRRGRRPLDASRAQPGRSRSTVPAVPRGPRPRAALGPALRDLRSPRSLEDG